MSKKITDTSLRGINWKKLAVPASERSFSVTPEKLNAVTVTEYPEDPKYRKVMDKSRGRIAGAGYHASEAEPASVREKGLIAHNPLVSSGADFTDEEMSNTHGVYFYSHPHTEYGSNLYRIAYPHNVNIVGEHEQVGEGDIISQDVPKRWVKYIGHAGEGGFHSTHLTPEECPVCNLGLEGYNKALSSLQFNSEK
jgi:hypothetical protein